MLTSIHVLIDSDKINKLTYLVIFFSKKKNSFSYLLIYLIIEIDRSESKCYANVAQ